MSNITAIKPAVAKPIAAKAPKAKQDRKQSKATLANQRRQFALGVAVACIGTLLLFLSVSHLASGIQTFTQGAQWEAIACAITIDLAFIGLEMTQIISLTDKIRNQLDRYAKPAIVGTLLASAAINAYVFSAHATGFFAYAAGLIGLMTPLLTYALFRVATILIIASK